MTVTLITGASGLLGPYLVEAFAALGPVIRVARRHGDSVCDLADPAGVARLIGDGAPDIVVHAAGFTDVDGCARDAAEADRANRLSAANLAAALPADRRLVMIGTDQVYAGTGGLCREGEEAPVNEYGRSKLAGARAVCGHPRGVVLNTNLFGPSRTPGRSSLSDVMAANFRDGRAMTLFTDALFSPLHMATLAELCVQVASSPLTGMVNAGSRDGMSKRDFGHAVADHLGLSTAMAQDGLSTRIPGRAPRPLDLRMDVGKIEHALGRPMPTLLEEIAKL